MKLLLHFKTLGPKFDVMKRHLKVKLEDMHLILGQTEVIQIVKD